MTSVSTQVKVDKVKVINVNDSVEEMIDLAVNEARDKTSQFNQEKELSLLLQDKVFSDQLYYCLAENIAAEISKNDAGVESVYLFDPSANPGMECGDYLPIEPCLHLLLVVEKASAGLEAYLSALDRATTEVIKKLPAPMYAGIHSFLDVILVTRKDVKARKGYAALISSIYSPPLRVWGKE